MNKTRLLTFIVVVFLFLFSACKKDVEPTVNTTLAMGTVITQSVYGEDVEGTISKVTKLVNDLDTKRLSWRIEGSEIYNINKTGEAEVSKVVLDCIQTCLEISKDTDNLFDITVGNLTNLWGIGTENAKLPTEKEIENAIKNIDASRISINGNTIKVAEGQNLDLGAVGKGLACDEIKFLLDSESSFIPGGIFSVGGSILLYGENPNTKNGTFNVGIRNPYGTENDSMGIITCKKVCVSTSGDYEKILTVDGKNYHHILNPKTGYPAESNITGVTVVSESGVLSDALSTACFILGYGDKSKELLSKYNSSAVFIMKDRKVHTFGNIEFKIIDDSFKMG
ncbi:MAG: FAD:protein FMN transferase [Ruminococcaceae bacterium]|nr:FAD:protein FMN transferase [Oscillospiraceae bacterium]